MQRDECETVFQRGIGGMRHCCTEGEKVSPNGGCKGVDPNRVVTEEEFCELDGDHKMSDDRERDEDELCFLLLHSC